MLNTAQIEQSIKEFISKNRKLGEHAGGSGHLAYRSLIKFTLDDLKEVKYRGESAIEVNCKYEIYTETEFLHPPEEDEFYTEHYREKYILDNSLKMLSRKVLSS